MRVQTAFNADPMLGLRQIAQFVKLRDEIIAETAGDPNNLLDINGVKIYIDGVVEGKSAVLLSPYEKVVSDVDNYNSPPVWNIEQLNKFCAEAEKQGFRLHFHAIGDGAVRIALDAIEYAHNANGLTDMRHGITHVQLVADIDFKRFADLGVSAAINPYWMFKDDYFYDIELPYLGAARAEKEYPNNSFVKNGVMVNTGSDYPVTIPCAPLEGIQIGVTRSVPKSAGTNLSYGSIKDTNDAKYYQPLWADERVSVLQMLTASTYNGAYSYAMEDITGSIAAGKSADFLVLDENIFTAKPEHIRDIKILRRVFRGVDDDLPSRRT
jgi:predicted amidohydrolase YtcJ